MLISGVASWRLRLPLVSVLRLVWQLAGAESQRHQGAQPVSLNAAALRSGDAILQRYFSNDEMLAYLQDHVQRCGGISRLFSIGKSSSGRRDLWVLEISNNPGVVEPKPYVKFVANMHGNEPSGRQVLLQYAEWMCRGYASSDPAVRRLVDNMHVMLLPTMNPDGYDKRWRGNSRGKDLNRDFPDPIHRARGAGWSDNLAPSGQEQPETSAVMRWAKEYRFVAGVSMHEGAVVANYPWDGSLDRKTHYSACPDDKAYQYLARLYARSNPVMAASHEFRGGITNGALWYPLWGGMQDWNYIAAGCFELTLELAQHKWPAASLLPRLWEDNKWALLNFTLAAAYGGAWGAVRGVGSGPLGGASVKVAGIDKDLNCGPLGDFYRPLAPGKYIITAEADGHQAQSKEVEVPADGSGIRLEFVLPIAPHFPSLIQTHAVQEGPPPHVAPHPVLAQSAVLPAQLPQSPPAFIGESLSRWHEESGQGATSSRPMQQPLTVAPQSSATRLVPAALWASVLLVCLGVLCRNRLLARRVSKSRLAQP